MPNRWLKLELPWDHRTWRRYGVAVASVLLGWLVREALTPAVGATALPFITFFPAVALAAWYGGLGPGVLSIALSIFVADYFHFEPLYSFKLDDAIPFVAFPVAAVFIVGAFEAMHRTKRAFIGAHDVLSTTLTSIGDGVIVTDAHGRVTLVNPEAERLTGWLNRDARGRPLDDVFRIINEQTRRSVDTPLARVLGDGAVLGLANHTLLIAKDGSETPIDDSAAPVQRAGEPVLGAVLVFRDVRQQRVAQIAAARLAAIIESSGDAIASKTLEGTVVTWNAAAERMFGYSAAEMIGKPITTLIPPEHLDEEAMILGRLRSGQEAELIETTRLTKDGRKIPVSVRVSPLRNSEGTVVGASKIVRDLSDVVAARNALAVEKELLTVTLEGIGDAVIATDIAARVTFLNPVAAQLTGWTQSDAVGQPLTDVFRIVNESTRAEVENPALRAMRDGVIVGLANHTLLLARSGAECAIDDSAAPIRSRDGQLIGSVLVFRDVSEQRRIDAEKQMIERSLREADQRKNEFLATLAHELRNPLAPIKNSITLLQIKGPQDEELVAARDVIARQVQHLSRLLDDLLDVNRLGRKKLDLRLERVTLAAIIGSAMETARPLIESGHHHVSVEVPQDIVLDADPMRLAQVFSNLLSNAAKYMDAGGHIWVMARRDGREVVVSVKDAGIGIGSDSLSTVFDMFTQMPLSLERSQGGVGIGLALAKWLVELHGGTIVAHSGGPDKGSEFVVRLPVGEGAALSPTAPGRERPAPAGGAARRIVIADDLRDSADTLAMILKAMGHEVHVAYDGVQAFALCEKVRPDAALLDLAMPGMSGYETCRRIRAEPWGKSIYLIAQTGWGQDEDRRHTEEAGFDRHMLKPIDSAELVAILSNLGK